MMSLFDRHYIIQGELCDTYGGDYTWRDIWWEEDAEGVKHFYEECWGAKESRPEEIYDSERVAEYIERLKEKNEND